MKQIKQIIINLILVLAFSINLFAADEAQKITIAIADFKAVNVDESRVEVVRGVILDEVIRTGKFDVVEREVLTRVLKEQQVSSSDLFDPKKAVKIGQLLSAKGIIVGSIVRIDNEIHIQARYVSILTGRIASSEVLKINVGQDLIQASRIIVRRLLKIEETTPVVIEEAPKPELKKFNINLTAGSGALGWFGGELTFLEYFAVGLKVGFSAGVDDINNKYYTLPIYLYINGYLFKTKKTIRPYITSGFGYAIKLKDNTEGGFFGLSMIGSEFNLSRSFTLFAEVGMIYKARLLFQFGGGVKFYLK
jgi:hypothetical protein